ncbi:hypothetical protein IAQ61_000303 [Plenodomus lingam]|uniref:Predicted protein n=1 Tax=Leptosphaeria maculans (strain JN3 / isolate v23.1.3 / race Av1-4-5-6-7-8) TaxID=985895 RepID=E5R5F3_LEPMJ|nr:predicted protein [Plenodomus lingam JN3]KAH9881577.1 hypothetical protein IAQ61_000303 [Plenodomus lingam]CBX92123.1 predicted protein [Plenodomus lingam JN3]
MRLTRAAQRAQEGTEAITGHDDNHHDQVDVADNTERAALNEISANPAPEQVECEEELPKKTPAKTPAKKGKKGGAKKGAKGKKAKDLGEQQEEEPVQDALEDEPAAAAAPVVDEAVDNVIAEPQNGEVEVTKNDERPTTPISKPVRLTRRQLAAMKEEEEEKLKKSQRAPSPTQDPVTIEGTVKSVEEATTGAHESDDADAQKEAAAESEAPEIAREPKVTAETVQGEMAQIPEVIPEAVQDKVAEEPEAPHHAEPEKADQLERNTIKQESIEIAPSIESDAQESTAITPSVQVTSDAATPTKLSTKAQQVSAEQTTLAAEQPGEQAMSPESYTPSRRRASRSPSKSPMRIEESFEAIDALEEALDSLDAVTSFDRPIEEASPRKKALVALTENSQVRAKTPSKAPSKTTAAPTRISRVPSAVPTGMKATKTSLARASNVRAASTKEGKSGSTGTVDYLASKRRPISVSFPTPPPPPKGRAPTKAIFELSSNGIVAKLKAQKEERIKRETDGLAPKQRPISMPPPPKSSKPLTKPAFQLPGEKTAEKLKAQKEERLKKQAEAPRQSMARPVSICMAPATAKSTKPATKPTNFQLPGAAVAEKLKAQKEERLKRQEEAEAAKKEAAIKPRTAPIVRKPVTLPVRNNPGVTIPPPTSQSQLQSQSQIRPPSQRSISTSATSNATKRNSVALSQSRSTSTSSISANRASIIPTKSTATPSDAAIQRGRGKEVFNRNKAEKEDRERERTDKENAAKKARAEAAERGRIASREWAEKQRKKMMAAAS